MNTLNVLMVDTFPFVIEGYVRVLEEVSSCHKKTKLNVLKAHNTDAVDMILNEADRKTFIDLVLLDINLPSSKKHQYLPSEDLAIKIKKTFKDVKIIAFTSHQNNHKLYNTIKRINPDAFLIKSDFTHNDLVKAVEDVLLGVPYYSKTVAKLIRKHMSNQIVLDYVDREILYHLSTGVKTKDLPVIINLSLAGIERRKRNLKNAFNIDKKGDKFLIDIAKERGFV